MNERKWNVIVLWLYLALVIALAGFTALWGRSDWTSLLRSQDWIVLGVLCVSAIAVEARPLRWGAMQYTTMAPTVLLLALLVVEDPALIIPVAGVGALLGYGVLYEFRLYLRNTPGQAVPRALFYAASSVAAAAIASRLPLFLPESVPDTFVTNVLVALGLTLVYVLLSRALAASYNRLSSSVWSSETALPTHNMLLLVLTIVAPILVAFFCQTLPYSSVDWIRQLGPEMVQYLIMLTVWPLFLGLFSLAAEYMAINLEGESIKQDYTQLSLYSETVLDMDGVVELVIKEMRAEFGCDDCIIYSWNSKDSVYELEGGLVEGQIYSGRSAQSMPDIGWPVQCASRGNVLGEASENAYVSLYKGHNARAFVEKIGSDGPRCAALMVLPLRCEREERAGPVRVGFIVLTKRTGGFVSSALARANNRMRRLTPAHIGLRQARLYRDAQQFFVGVNEAVSQSGKVLAATKALFAKGIDPAKFVEGVQRGVHTRALIQVVDNIAQGRFPDEGDRPLDDEGIRQLYAGIQRQDANLPEPTPEIIGYLRAFLSSWSIAFVLPYQWPSPEYGGITAEMRELYALFSAALQGDTIDDILTFGARLNDVEKMDRLAAKFPEAVEEVRNIKPFLDILKLSQSPGSDAQTRGDHLAEAARMLEPEIGRQPASPEQVVIAHIRNLWASVVYNTRREVLGPSDIRMELETETVSVHDGGILILLRVGNDGKTPATNVSVGLDTQMGEYQLLDQPGGMQHLGTLDPGQRRVLSFTVLPRRKQQQFVRLAFRANWSDRLRADRSLVYAGRVILQSEAPEFVPIRNPYVPGPPLRPGSKMFMGREDVFGFVRDGIGVRGQHNVLTLIGPRRTGKTSLAFQLSERLDRNLYVVAYIDGQALGIEEGTDLFLRDLSWTICLELEGYDVACEPLSAEDSERSATERFEHEFLPRVFDAIGQRSLVLVFDEFEVLADRVKEGKLDVAVFGFLRHLMQLVQNLAFVFVGTHRLQELSLDYWSILFSSALQKKIGFLDRESARRLISEPTELEVFDPLAVDEIMQLTAGHPYFVQLLCRYMIDFRNRAREPFITAQHVRDAIPELLVQAEGHLVNLWETASPEHQLVMATASQVLRSQDTVQVSDLTERLAAYGIDQTPENILLSQEELTMQEIFERTNADAPGYRFKVELIQRWIERDKPLTLVKQSLA